MILAEPDADKQTAELIELAQRELHGDSVLSDEAGFARLQARMSQPRSRWLSGWLPAVGVAVSATALAGVLFVRAAQNHITFEVAGGALVDDARVVGEANTRIRFSDGSEAKLSRGSEAEIHNVTEHGAEVVLKR